MKIVDCESTVELPTVSVNPRFKTKVLRILHVSPHEIVGVALITIFWIILVK